MAKSTRRIDLRWVDQADNETGFIVEMKGTEGTYQTVQALGREVESFSVLNLEENTPYFFRIQATNQNGASKYSNEISARTLARVTLSTQIPSAQYQMISLPFQPDQGDAEWVLGDELGAYDLIQWRLGHWKSGAYQEYPNIDPFMPGKGYWLIVKKAIEISGEGISTDDYQPFRIRLEPGWNQMCAGHGTQADTGRPVRP